MKMTTVKATEWTYPDRFEYRSGADRADIFGARSSYAEIQLVFSGVPEGASVSAKASGAIAAFDVEWYELVPVFVEANANLPENDESRDEWIPSRAAPYWLYDCVKPLGAHLTPKDGGAARRAFRGAAVAGCYAGGSASAARAGGDAAKSAQHVAARRACAFLPKVLLPAVYRADRPRARHDRAGGGGPALPAQKIAACKAGR